MTAVKMFARRPPLRLTQHHMFPKAAVRLLSLFACIVIFTTESLAQRGLQLSVKDAQGKPIAYAGFVIQCAAGDSIIYTGLTDSAGFFSGAVLPVSACVAEAQADGFIPQKQWIPDTVSPAVTLQISLEASSKTLRDVVITARKPLLERKADRTIFNVESSVSSVGADALEVMKRAPGLRVTNSTLSIAGKSTVNVMINDKLVQLDGAELTEMLKSIPADNIARIEVITTPPAKYDAAGNAGLVNIVLKKQLKDGFNGQVTGIYNQHTYGGYGLSTSFNYRKNRFNVFGTGNAFHTGIYNRGQVTSYYPGQELRQDIGGKYLNVFNRLQVGVDYSLNPQMIIGVLYTIGNGGWKYQTDERILNTAYSLPAHAIDSTIRTDAQTRDRGFRNVYNINWEWKIDTSGKKMSADVDYFTRRGTGLQAFRTQDFGAGGAATGVQSDNRNDGLQFVDIRTGKVDVEWPARLARLAFGAKATFRHNTSDNQFSYWDGAAYVNDAGRTNSFDYRENTQALYFSAQKTVGRWDFQAGLRGEYTQTRGYSATTAITTATEYFKLFPTAYALWHYNEHNELGINYSRRIERPEFWLLNPFRTYTTLSSYESGNPYLQPSFAHNIELNYTYKSKYTATAFAEKVDQYFTRYSTVDTVSQGIIFSQANLGKAYSYGLSLSANTSLVKWWEVNLQLRGYRAVFQSHFYANAPAVEYSKGVFSVDLYNTFSLNKSKTLLAEAGGQYTSAQLSDFDLQKPIGSASAGIKALLMKKRLTIGINVQDIFRTDVTDFRNLSNGTVQRFYGDEQTLHVAVSWKFGNNGVKALRERNGDSDEAKRAR